MDIDWALSLGPNRFALLYLSVRNVQLVIELSNSSIRFLLLSANFGDNNIAGGS